MEEVFKLLCDVSDVESDSSSNEFEDVLDTQTPHSDLDDEGRTDTDLVDTNTIDTNIVVEPFQKTDRQFLWKRGTFDSFVSPIHENFHQPINPVLPLQYFERYFADEHFQQAAQYTNMYHFQKFGTELKTDALEIKQLYGAHLYFGCIKHPRLRMYWEVQKFGSNIVSAKITRNRLFLLRKCLHFVDTAETQGEASSNYLWKVQPVIDAVRSRCLAIPRNFANYSIDQQMIPLFGRLPRGLRQYIRNKSRPVGLRNFVITSTTDMEDFMDLALLGIIGSAACKAHKGQQVQSVRNQWIQELNLARDVEGFYAQNLEKMQRKDPEQFFKITRMTPNTFKRLRALIEPHLAKLSWRESISPSSGLFLVLLYLAQGVPKQVLAWIFRLGFLTVETIIYETCDVIWKVLMPLHIQPLSKDNWKKNAIDFENIWNLPNCVAAVDGRHVNIRCPPKAGSEHYYYTEDRSIVLLAACDANYVFVAVDIGDYGTECDLGTISEYSFGKKLLTNNLNLPPASYINNTNIKFNYFLVGDATFPLKPYLMRPYPGKILIGKRLNFNKRISRARRVIENAFGILVARWRILETTLNMIPSNAKKIIKSTVVLHNFIKVNDAAYCPKTFVDNSDENDVIIHRGQWRNEINPLTQAGIGSNFSSQESNHMRDIYKDYLYDPFK